MGADGLQIILVNPWPNEIPDGHDAYLAGQGFTQFVSYYGDPGPGYIAQYYVDANPGNVLIDRDGHIRKYDIGAIDGEPRHTDWDRVIKQLIGKD